ncbi:glycosyltransferase family 2 protein [Vibrio cholerae]|uniref:Beta-1,3-glucosyltransferase n=1 Tax=Vibrio cholerae TaxID=666 RepID=D6NLX1_VIBCL|nr:beta-1,3-glucosyltransferase [Vibrio cholerae]ELH8888556.1 glycosyltransferase family 2 protein [Vibrio cholerae]BCN16834.1 putative glycosyltransferase [Vibrio cholerae]GHX40374.1 Putative N-acetylgalactosaminyl-diphosphoundecaprenol glucuronosyltransferase [Vibrio cholerae]
MNRQIPLVTVIIPCFNHEFFVQESIQSIIEQEYDNLELIIIDDGSKDNSVKVIESMLLACESRFKRVVFNYRENKGVSATLNEGISLAQGEMIVFCASDDAFHELKVSSQVDFFNAHPDIHFCYTQTYVYDDNGQILESQTCEANKDLHDNITFDEVFTFKIHFPVTGMYRTEFLKDVLNGFDENLSAEDYDINLKILSNSKAGYIENKLYYYRSPAAVGSSRKRPVMRVDVSESHLKSIYKYSNHHLFNAAVLEWNFRRFIYFSSYSKTKLYALKGAIKSVSKANSFFYFKALVRLFLLWR